MEEKILVKGENVFDKKAAKLVSFLPSAFFLCLALLLGILCFSAYHEFTAFQQENLEILTTNNAKGTQISDSELKAIDKQLDKIAGLVAAASIAMPVFIICLILGGFWLIYGTLLYFLVLKNEITVTDKRVYGKIAFGRRISLPMDSISAVSTSLMKGIGVYTSSKRIAFGLIRNRDKLYSVLCTELMKRQEKNLQMNTVPKEADELKKYKDLLDNGVISQEEYNTLKHQLMGL